MTYYNIENIYLEKFEMLSITKAELNLKNTLAEIKFIISPTQTSLFKILNFPTVFSASKFGTNFFRVFNKSAEIRTRKTLCH